MYMVSSFFYCIYNIQYIQPPSAFTVYMIYNIYDIILPLLYMIYNIYNLLLPLLYIWCHPPSIVYIILKSLGDYSVFNNLISLLLPYFLLAKTRSCYYRHFSVIPNHLKLGSIDLLYHWSPWLNLKPFLL